MSQHSNDEVEAVAEIRAPLERFAAATSAIESLQQQIQLLSEVRAIAVAELHSSGLTYREIGEDLGLSAQRVGQMVAATGGVSHLLKSWGEVERKLGELGSYAEVSSSSRAMPRLVDALLESGHLDADLAQRLLTLHAARNDAAHSRREMSDEVVDDLLSGAVALSAQLELRVQDARETNAASFTDERLEAEALLRRVAQEYPDIDWREGRCEECGRPIPIPAQGMWVCSRSCRDHWFRKLYHYIDPGSEEETMTRTPNVVPYWI